MVNIAVIGASTAWFPTLGADLMAAFEDPLAFRLIDIDPRNADLCCQWGRLASKAHQRQDTFTPFTDRRAGLAGADAVLITVATGGLEAMSHDLSIPEKYGVYATVGDTTGPGGWARAIRNIPVFRAFADDISEICPRAFLANYTNPMAALTATLAQCCDNPVVGLCHAYFETKDVIQKIFGLDNWGGIATQIAGMNHFTWVTDFTIDHQPGYPQLRKRVGSGSLADVLPAKSADEIGIVSTHEFCVELYDAFGYLPYPADRHTSEFLSFTLSGRGEYPERYTNQAQGKAYDTTRYCNIRRTPIEDRYGWMDDRAENMRKWLAGEKELPRPSRETSAQMIRAYIHNQPFADAVNTINCGQIPQLPLGACVETIGVIDGLGVRPVMVADVPEHLAEVMRPQAIGQKWITEGALKGDKDLLLQALYRDPQCAHLQPGEIRAMAEELLAANAAYFSL